MKERQREKETRKDDAHRTLKKSLRGIRELSTRPLPPSARAFSAVLSVRPSCTSYVPAAGAQDAIWLSGFVGLGRAQTQRG